MPPAARRGSRRCCPPACATASWPRTLLTGILLALADRRPAHLTEAHAALSARRGRVGAGGVRPPPPPRPAPAGRPRLRPTHRRLGTPPPHPPRPQRGDVLRPPPRPPRTVPPTAGPGRPRDRPPDDPHRKP